MIATLALKSAACISRLFLSGAVAIVIENSRPVVETMDRVSLLTALDLCSKLKLLPCAGWWLAALERLFNRKSNRARLPLFLSPQMRTCRLSLGGCY